MILSLVILQLQIMPGAQYIKGPPDILDSRVTDIGVFQEASEISWFPSHTWNQLREMVVGQEVWGKESDGDQNSIFL